MMREDSLSKGSFKKIINFQRCHDLSKIFGKSLVFPPVSEPIEKLNC